MGPVGSYGRGLSLLTGWLPIGIQIVAVLVVLVVVLRSAPRRWYLLWLPVAVVAGTVVAGLVAGRVAAEGLSDDPAPPALWVWVGVTGAAAVVAVVGWRGARLWRGLSVLAVPLGLLCVASTLNVWVGYFPTVQVAWAAVTAAPMPDQVSDAQLTAMLTAPRPQRGALVGVDVPDTASGFVHREEYVYLPPTWFTGTSSHPALPAVMMIGGEFNTPADWVRTGNALSVVDAYARGACRCGAHPGVRRRGRHLQQRHPVRRRPAGQLGRPPRPLTGRSWAGRWAARARRTSR